MSEVPEYTSRDLLKFEQMTEEQLSEYPGAKEQLEAFQEKLRVALKPMTDRATVSAKRIKESMPKFDVASKPGVSFGTPAAFNSESLIKTVKLHPDTITDLAQAIAAELKK